MPAQSPSSLTTDIRRHTRMILVAFAVLASTLVLVTVRAQPAAAAETCVGAECDTIAFVDPYAVFTVWEDVVPFSLVGRFIYGNPGDEPIMGDWDCDGDQTPGMYRRSTGLVYLRNSNTQGIADEQYIFGNPSDIPIVGDWDGDGCDTVSIYRPSEAKFYLSNTLGAGYAETEFHLGEFGDQPVIGDWDRDGDDTVGIFRPSTGLVALTNSSSWGTVHHSYYFGGPGDVALGGDWDGDGDDTIGLYRYSAGTVYINNGHRSGNADYSIAVGRHHRALAASGITHVPGATVNVPGLEAPPPRQSSGPIRVSDDDVVIENLHITNPHGDCVHIGGSANVTIRNSTIGPCGGNGIYITDSADVTVVGNYITESARGVLAHRSETIKVNENAFAFTGRNFVQFDKVNGPGSSISGNRGANELGGSNAEDLISLYQSNGTSGSPIRIANNHLKDGGPSSSGSGIMLGDGGGSHQVAEGNVLVDPGQVGIGVAGGDDMRIVGNRIYSSAHHWSNVAMYAAGFSASCGDVEIVGNHVDWTAAGGYQNGFWDNGSCDLDMYGNVFDADLGTWIW